MINKSSRSKIFLAVIPARSGSKGIKDKNIKKFCGKPLIAHTIGHALGCKRIRRVIVSTDSTKYAEIAKKYGAEVPFLRPKELSGDKSPIFDTIKHLLITIQEQENYVPDYIVLLQTTSPLRTVSDIDRCIDVIIKTKADAVMTMCSTEQLLYTIDNKGILQLLFNKKWLTSTNRQTLPATYKINGPAVLVVSVKSALKKGNRSLIRGKVAGIIMEKWRSPDLDEAEDWVLAELLYKNRLSIDRKATL